jgi:RimJ/RimL family protein N-acetyltransferase
MIAGERVALTELRQSDCDVLLGWINDPETVRLNAPYAPVHEPGHLAWFDAVTADPSRIVFAVRHLSEPRIIGILQLVDIHPVHRSAELIIRIGDDRDRNRGAGSEAARLAVDFAFRDRNLQRVWLRVFSDNQRAIRAYEKAGLRVEGTLSRAAFIGGLWRDETVMAVLADLGGDGLRR